MKRIIFYPLTTLLLLFISLLFTVHSFAHGEAGVIHLMNDLYNPATVTIYKDEKLLFENDSTDKRWPEVSFRASPKYPPLHFYADQPLNSGQTWLFKFQYTGTWEYQDRINPNIKGTFTVAVGRGYSHVPEVDVKSPSVWDHITTFFSWLFHKI